MKSTTFVLALAASANAVIVARDTATILSDISTISDDVDGLTTALNGFSGEFSQVTPILNAESDLEAAIKKGTADAQATSPVTEEDADSVLTAVKNLIPGIAGALNALVSKVPDFNGIGVGSVIPGLLSALKSETDDFAAALVAIAPDSDQAAASAAVSCIDQAFEAAQATQSVDGSCASDIVIGGSSPTTSSGPTATSSTGSSPTTTDSTTSTGSSTPTDTTTAGPTITTPYPTGTAPPGTGYSSTGGVYPTDLPWSNAGAAVKVGMSGAAAVAALAMVL